MAEYGIKRLVSIEVELWESKLEVGQARSAAGGQMKYRIRFRWEVRFQARVSIRQTNLEQEKKAESIVAELAGVSTVDSKVRLVQAGLRSGNKSGNTRHRLQVMPTTIQHWPCAAIQTI